MNRSLLAVLQNHFPNLRFEHVELIRNRLNDSYLAKTADQSYLFCFYQFGRVCLEFSFAPTESSRGDWACFLNTYQASHPLSEQDLEAIPLFVMARRFWFAKFY